MREEAIAMLFALLFLMFVLATCLFVAAPALRGPAAVTGDTEPLGAGAQPESLEGVLVAQLVTGEIHRRQYLLAMERLAARDEVRSPLAVPPEIGSSDV